MSEIEKLYENANVEKEWKPLPYGDIEEYYPEFTAEKQLELICFIVNRQQENRVIFDSPSCSLTRQDITDCIAQHINNLWQDLSDTEKAEIRGILE